LKIFSTYLLKFYFKEDKILCEKIYSLTDQEKGQGEVFKAKRRKRAPEGKTLVFPWGAER